MSTIDWSVFDKFPEMTCTCVCGTVFRTHAKGVPGVGLVARKPCPVCGETRMTRASSDVERMEIGRKTS